MQPPHSFRFSQRSESGSLSQSLRDTLSRRNRVDTFSINLINSSRFRASLSGTSPKAKVQLELVNATGQITRGSARSLNAELPAGRYRLRAVLKNGQFSRYQLRYESNSLTLISGGESGSGSGQGGNALPNVPDNASPNVNNPDNRPITRPVPPQNTVNLGSDLGGNSLANATSRGRVGSNLTLSDDLGNGDPVDWYQVTVGDGSGGTSRLNLALSSTSGAGVYARVYSATDLSSSFGDVVFEKGKTHQNPTSLALANGTYYVKVAPVAASGQLTYNLKLQETAIPDLVGNSPDQAVKLNQGQPLNPGASFTATDFVGPGDIFDYYSFTTTQPTTLNIQFERLGTHRPERSRILYQLDRADGTPGVNWVNSSGASLHSQFALTQPSQTFSGQLAAGTYTLQLRSFFSNGDNPYRMTISTSTP